MFLNQKNQLIYEEFSMEEAFERAVDEIKRVDHLFYVSLKYTRTVDVLISVMQRMINSIDHCMDSLLIYAKEKGQLEEEIPSNPGLKCDMLKKTFVDNPAIVDYANFYTKLRKLVRAEHTKREEFRRHVTMIAVINNGEIVEVDIDLIKEYYEKTKEFLTLVKNKIQEV